MLATIASSTTAKLALEICSDLVNSSGTAATKASDDVFSIEMVSLPVGGMITRIACGRTIRRITCSRVMPSACAASVWPCSTEMMPARTISAMYAASFKPRPRVAARNGLISWLVPACKLSEVPGMPIPMWGRTMFRLYQKKICTSTGVPRKNQM